MPAKSPTPEVGYDSIRKDILAVIHQVRESLYGAIRMAPAQDTQAIAAAILLIESAPALLAQRDALREALNTLVKMYVANLGNPASEFISCITPLHASDLTAKERAKDSTWSAWDAARAALALAQPQE